MSKFRGAATALAILLAPGLAPAQVSDEVVRIGVLTDLSGPYADFAGPGSVLATRMAIEDHGGKALGKPVEVVDLSDDDYTAGLVAAGLPEPVARLFASFGTATREGFMGRTSTAVADLTGRAATPLAALVA